jgi:RNA polymerase sigma-70 factor (ECF subfamily)
MEPILQPGEADDRALMLRTCGGDREAFTEIVRRHQRSLLNFFRRSGVYTDAEDLVQQTFVRLYRYRDRYRPSAKLTTFLFLLARQVWIDEIRRRQRAERLRQGLEAEPLPEPADARPPEHGRIDVERALAALPEGLRVVVVMAVYERLPYAEIAAALQIPVGTVKSRMFNALRLLRRVMEDRPGEKPE